MGAPINSCGGIYIQQRFSKRNERALQEYSVGFRKHSQAVCRIGGGWLQIGALALLERVPSFACVLLCTIVGMHRQVRTMIEAGEICVPQRRIPSSRVPTEPPSALGASRPKAT